MSRARRVLDRALASPTVLASGPRARSSRVRQSDGFSSSPAIATPAWSLSAPESASSDAVFRAGSPARTDHLWSLPPDFRNWPRAGSESVRPFQEKVVAGGGATVSRLHQLSSLGQSVWIDFLSRDLLESGALARAVDEDAVVGVTSNPTIFAKALARSDSYDAQLSLTRQRQLQAALPSPCDARRQHRLRSAAARLGTDKRPRRLRVDRGRPQPCRRHRCDGEGGDATSTKRLQSQTCSSRFPRLTLACRRSSS